jgi:hypothetical protein
VLINLKTKKTNAQKSLDYVNTKQGRFRNLVKGAKASATQRGHAFELTFEDVCLLWLKQRGKCAYTDWDMDCITGSNKLVSIERIDNSLGYIHKNCILVCWCVNRARNTLNIDFFIEMCKAVASKNN